MQIELSRDVEALLRSQVAAGHFDTIEQALAAAVYGAPMADEKLGELSWAVPYLDEADRAVAAGKTVGEAEAFAALGQRLRQS